MGDSGKMNKLSVIINTCILVVIILFCVFFRSSGAQTIRAERSFEKAFRNDYPGWKITKIVLREDNDSAFNYHGFFDCVAISDKPKCFIKSCYFCSYRKPHEKGCTIRMSVSVLFSHSSCYYTLSDKNPYIPDLR